MDETERAREAQTDAYKRGCVLCHNIGHPLDEECRP